MESLPCFVVKPSDAVAEQSLSPLTPQEVATSPAADDSQMTTIATPPATTTTSPHHQKDLPDKQYNQQEEKVNLSPSSAREFVRAIALDSIGMVHDHDHDEHLSPIPLAHDSSRKVELMGTQRMSLTHDNYAMTSLASSEGKETKRGWDTIVKNNNKDSSTTSSGGDADHSDMNNSVASQGSLREEEIERMKEELGATSLEFIRRLRGAAFRRKLDLTRSRDTLAAKEREHREAIAASRAAAQNEQRRKSEPVLPSSSSSILRKARPSFQFHARPLPATTGVKGSGGLAGVPTVAKKPTTTPCSPLLGPRRRHHQEKQRENDSRERDLDDDDDDSSRSPVPRRDQHIFRALPLPSTTGELGHAGLTGVPKVDKRPTTVPQSPLLGPRRSKPSIEESRNVMKLGGDGNAAPPAMVGIPKVEKRTTVPQSPLLGPRRPKQSIERSRNSAAPPAMVGIPKVEKRPNTIPRSPLLGLRRRLKSPKKETRKTERVEIEETPNRRTEPRCPSNSSQRSGASSVTLVGLTLIDGAKDNDTTSCQAGICGEACDVGGGRRAPLTTHDANKLQVNDDEYRPHSSVRATRRAFYNSLKAANLQERQEKESRERKARVKALKRELKELSKAL